MNSLRKIIQNFILFIYLKNQDTQTIIFMKILIKQLKLLESQYSIIDVKKKFSNDSDVLNFYAKFGGHYSILGYKEVAKSIDRFLKKNPSR